MKKALLIFISIIASVLLLVGIGNSIIKNEQNNDNSKSLSVVSSTLTDVTKNSIQDSITKTSQSTKSKNSTVAKITNKKSSEKVDKKDGSNSTSNKTITSNKKSSAETTSKKTTTNKKIDNYVYLTIDCKNIEKDGYEYPSYISSSGYIISNYKVKYTSNMTAFDLLNKGCKANKVSFDTISTGFGRYIVGINNIEEKQFGKTSGWTYYVNTSFPNVSCDKYKLKKGDKVRFTYVCKYTD